jgi:hypothetical protein
MKPKLKPGRRGSWTSPEERERTQEMMFLMKEGRTAGLRARQDVKPWDGRERERERWRERKTRQQEVFFIDNRHSQERHLNTPSTTKTSFRKPR